MPRGLVLAATFGQQWRRPGEADMAGERDVEEFTGAERAAGEAPPPVHRIVEAMRFVGGPPLTAVRAGEAVRGLGAEQLRQVVETLNRDYRRQGRPYRVQRRDQGYELVLLPHYRGVP